MIIALTTDSETIIASRYLGTLYQERILPAVEFFDPRPKNDHFTDSQRLTFLSHSKNIIDSEGKITVCYAGMSARAFAHRLTGVLSPVQAKQISHIDFIGCNIGHVDAEGHGFVIDVTRHLQEAGYQLSINTFMSPKHSYDSLLVTYFPTAKNGMEANSWYLLGLKTADDTKSVQNLDKKLRMIDIKKENLCTELNKLQQSASPTSIPHQVSKNAVKLMMLKRPQDNPLYANHRKAEISTELQTLNVLKIETAKERQNLLVVVARSTNPRTLFDANPEIYNAGYRLQQNTVHQLKQRLVEQRETTTPKTDEQDNPYKNNIHPE